MTWGASNERDRAKGRSAEERLARLFTDAGWNVIEHPFGQAGPDLFVHKPPLRPVLIEVRSKYPDKRGRYGLEHPKHLTWKAADICYVIWDTQRQTWLHAWMRDLPDPEGGIAGSYRSGGMRRDIPNAYWPSRYWKPLPYREDGPQ